MANVSYEANTGLSGMMNYQGALDGMKSAIQGADSSLKSAQAAMKAGDPTSVIEVQIQMSSFTQVMTTMTNMLKSLNDATSTANRNIS